MEKFNKLKSLNKTADKKAAFNVDSKMSSLIGAVIVVFLVVALAPEIFTELEDLTGTDSDVPEWVYTVMTVMVGAGLVFIVWRTFEK
ncbi:MAG: hypothetical protein ACOCZ5_01140 [bacterium]